MDTEWNDETDKAEDDKILKTKILNSMLKKGYIDEDEYREKLEDEHFTANDAATYYHIADAYAEADNDEGYTLDELKEKIKQYLDSIFRSTIRITESNRNNLKRTP